MKKTKSLHQRIVSAFVQLALGSCVFFGVLAALAVEGIEVYLVDERLANVASWASPRHAAKMPVDMPAGLVFYHGDDIPQFLRGHPQGVHEFFVDGNELHVLSGKDAAGDYVAIDHASEYDKIELIVYSMIAAGLLGFIVLSLFLGRLVARNIVTPITTLAAAVRENDVQSERALLNSKDEIGDLARAFTARTDELKHFLDRERFFTGDVSHELRTPLTVMIGAAEIIQANTRGQPLLQEASERILRTATEAAENITVLLLLARTPDLIDMPETDISAVAQDELKKHRVLLGTKPIALECAIQNDFSVSARRELLAAIIGNLIRNACLYTMQGAITVRIDQPTVVVEDTGPGIPDFLRARLMKEPIRTAQTGSAGTGLGLSLVSRICDHLGVQLHVTGRASGGTTFTIDFSPLLTKS